MRGPGSNPRPQRLLPPLLLLTSGVRVEAAASTRSCFSNPRDPAYLSNPGSLTLEPMGQRIRPDSEATPGNAVSMKYGRLVDAENALSA